MTDTERRWWHGPMGDADRASDREGEAVGAPPPDIPLAGDVVATIARRIGADRLAAWWEGQTGRPCGCEGRKAALNRATERLLRWLGRTR
jgi:hypothetical protein